MKTKSLFFLAIVCSWISSELSATCPVQSVTNPTYCYPIKGKWNETGHQATFTFIPTDADPQRFWCAFTPDNWTTYVDATGTYTPGTYSYTSKSVSTASWKSAGVVSLAIWKSTSSSCKEDCDALVTPSNFDCSVTPSSCVAVTDQMCTNFKACVDNMKRYITMSGLDNHSTGNWFAYSDDSWASYADITPSSLAVNQDVISVDMSTYKTNKGVAVTVPLKSTGSLSMIAHSGLADQCTAGGKQGLSVSSMTTCPPIGVGINEIITKDIVCFPNPAMSSDLIYVKGEYASDAKVSIKPIIGTKLALISTINVEPDDIVISINNLIPGIYILKIESEGKIYLTKLVIK
jgi:Secretion system C-terminal sorting domain